MDCRRLAALAFSLLSFAAGCAHNSTAVSSATPNPAAVTIAAKQDTLDPEALKRQPKPETFVAFGDYNAREADATPVPLQQEQLRDRARKSYQEALKIDPNNVPALKSLASLYASTNDYERAKQTYDAAIKLAANDATLWYGLGMTCARTRDWPAAVEHLTKATELDPENRSYQRYLGFTLARAGRNEEALTVFGRYEGEAKAHYYLAEMLEHLGQVDACKMQLQLALAQDPKLGNAAQMLIRLNGADPSGVTAAPTATSTSVQAVGYSEPARENEDASRVFMPPPPNCPTPKSTLDLK
jgi:tetratricopeptide (TPR) repeat protein